MDENVEVYNLRSVGWRIPGVKVTCRPLRGREWMLFALPEKSSMAVT